VREVAEALRELQPIVALEVPIPRAAKCVDRQALQATSPPGFPLARHRLDSEAPTGGVDSAGVPGQFCLWILNCSRFVWNVFSFRFLHLHYRDNTLDKGPANDVKRITYGPVSEHTN
jgi:hypothetical protein